MEEIVVVHESAGALATKYHTSFDDGPGLGPSMAPRRPGVSPRDLVPDREGLMAEYGRLYASQVDLFRRRARLEEEARALRDLMMLAGKRGKGGAALAAMSPRRVAAGTLPAGLLAGGERTALLGV